MKWTLIKAIAGRWLLPALLALAVVGIGVSWWHGYSTGRTVQRVEMQSEVEAARAEQAKVADELEREKRARRTAERDRALARAHTPDPSGCGAVAAPGGVLDSFGYAGPRPATDGASGQAAVAGANEPGHLDLGRGAAGRD